MASKSSKPAKAADKDQIFWNTILDKNINKKKLKKFKKYAKGIDADHLANLFSITKKEVENIYALFLRIDDDRSGAITAPEIAQGLSSFGCDVSPKVVQAVMRASDKNGDGEINFEEFLAVLVSKAKLKKHKASMDAVLKKLAERNEQLLTADSLRSAWPAAIGEEITAHEANALLALAETCGDSCVTYEHFKRMWQSA